MSRYKGVSGYRHDRVSKVGVLIANLGTPDAPTKSGLRRYLKEFLWDPRIVEIPRALWWMILNFVILNVRPAKSAKLYESVWTPEGSPLLVNSLRQEEKLRARLENAFPGRVELVLGMRYGTPSVASALDELREKGVERLIVLPLYPQYAAATAGSTFDAVADELKNWRWIPELRFIAQYHDHPAYIRAMADHIRAQWGVNGRSGYLLFSYHGIPMRCLKSGDPYQCQCHKTSRLLADALDLKPGEWQTSFQSRFGKEEWLKPYTDKTLKLLAKEGTTGVDVFCPGFSADCLETIEEIGEENREVFMEAGGKAYHYIPALNAIDEHIEALFEVVRDTAQGMPEWNIELPLSVAKKRAKKTLERAQTKGASK